MPFLWVFVSLDPEYVKVCWIEEWLIRMYRHNFVQYSGVWTSDKQMVPEVSLHLLAWTEFYYSSLNISSSTNYFYLMWNIACEKCVVESLTKTI